MEDSRSGIERLLSDPHIVRIEDAEDFGRLIIDLSLFRRTDFIENSLGALWMFLSQRYICDDFKAHQERWKWKQQVLNEYGLEAYQYLQDNALRRAHFGSVHLIEPYFKEENYIGTNKDVFIQKVSEMDASYTELADSIRESVLIDKVKLVKQKAYAVLKFLSEQKPAE